MKFLQKYLVTISNYFNFAERKDDKMRKENNNISKQLSRQYYEGNENSRPYPRR